MDVNDAELLALAGDDSSGVEDTPAAPPTAKAVSPLPTTNNFHNTSKDTTSSKGGSTPNASAKHRSAKRTKKPLRKAASEEEGEASSASGSPNSLDSAPMSESDSESVIAGDTGLDGPTFTIENKYYSEKDKKEIMSLSEVQREQILADRAGLLERKLQDQHLRHLREMREKAGTKSSGEKRKAGDLDESPRKSSRQKTTLGGRKVGEASKAIEAYKRQREEKGREQQRHQESSINKDRRGRSSSERLSSADAEGESDVEWDDGKPKIENHQARRTQQADYKDVKHVTLPRLALAGYCYHPGFADAAKDCYVRMVSKSRGSSGGVSEKEGFDYAVEKADGKKVVTNQHLLIAVDGSVQEFHFNGISNSPPTEAEVANYRNSMADAGKSLPSKQFLESKLADINAVINHVFTDAELDEKLRRSGALKNRAAPIERMSIMSRRKAALDQGDEAAVANCDVELAALNGPKLKYGTFLVDPKVPAPVATGPTEQERIHELNLKNRKENTQEVRKAQLAERKAERRRREAVLRGEALEDTFARVKTYAKTHYDVNDSLAPHRRRELSRSVTPAAVSTPKKEEPQPEFPSPAKKFTASGLPILGNRNMEDDIIASMDLGIDIEI